ncbi:MAG: tetratricopeptide repeat protein [bacterium]
MFDIFGSKDPQKALLKAQEYIKENRYDSAIKVLEHNLTDDEESLDLHLLLARLYYDAEERGRAVETLRNIKSVVPSRLDDIVAVMSELYYHHASIDAGDFLLEMHIEQHRYDEISKTLRQFSERELKLLLSRYDKLKQNLEGKNVISKKDFEQMLILSSIHFFIHESEAATEAIEGLIDVEVYAPILLRWIQVISRENYNDWRASLLLLRAQMANQDFNGALNTAQRAADKFADSVNTLIALVSAAKPPKDLEASYAQFLTNLYIKKGDLDASIELLQDRLKKDTKKIDDVIKGLRELERINPKNLKILYALGDTYIKANRITLAMSEYAKILETDATQYEHIIEKYKAAFEKEPNNPEVIDGLVKAYLSRNEIDVAVDTIDTAFKADPGLLDENIINLNTILEQDIENSKALNLLGVCYARKGDHETARLIFENLLNNGQYNYVYESTDGIVKEMPDDLGYVDLRAKSMLMLGHEQKALSLLEYFLDQHPEQTASLIPTFDALVNKKPNLGSSIIPIFKQYKKEDPFLGDLALARAAAFTGDYDTAVTLFEKLFKDEARRGDVKRALIEVIQNRQKAVPLLLVAARIFMKEGEVEIATKFFKTAQNVDPKAFFEIVDEFYDALKNFPKDREVRVLLIDTFFSRKLWDRVVEESKNAIEVFGRNAQYFNLKLGQASVEKGNLSDAVRPLMISLEGPENFSGEVIKYLDNILSIDKSNVPAHFARGRALSKAQRIDEAVEEYLLTVRILPARAEYVYEELKTLSSKAMANPLIVFAEGSVELILKKYDDAIKHLLQSCELDNSLVKRVLPLYEKLTKAASSPLLDFSMAKVYHLATLKSSAVKYYIKAQAAEKSYREPAISEMKKICAENPDDIESRKGLAEIYFNFNNLEDSSDLVREIYESDKKESVWAKKFVSNILQKDQQHIPSYYFLADFFLMEKVYKKAVEVFSKLIEIAPVEITNVIDKLVKCKDEHGELLLYLGNLYTDTGEINKALELFEKLFTLDASFGDAITYQIKEILKKNANIGEAYLLAQRIFVYQKEYERAIEAIKRAGELLPENEDIILKEGQIYYEMGAADKAIKLYTELLEKTHNRKAIYRLIQKTRRDYFNSRIEMTRGDADEERLERASLYILMNRMSKAKKELAFVPKSGFLAKRHTLLRAKFYLKLSRPINALEIMKDLPVDEETAPVYADIYETMGSYEAAALTLRQVGIADMEKRIAGYERLAQERRLAKGKYFIEGRS